MGPAQHKSQGSVHPKGVLSHIMPAPKIYPFPPKSAYLLGLEMAVHGLQMRSEKHILHGMSHFFALGHQALRLPEHITQVKECHAQ